MFEDYICLATTLDSQRFMNMNVVFPTQPPTMGMQPQLAPVPSTVDAPCDCCSKPEVKLSEQTPNLDATIEFIEKAANWIITALKELDKDNLENYTISVNKYPNEVGVYIHAVEPIVTQSIKSLSFTLSTYNNDPQWGNTAKIYVGGLYVNKKFNDVGSQILSVLKAGVMSLVNTAALNTGFVELWSAETAVMFYIKNGFMIRDLWDQKNPESRVNSVFRMTMFAMQEENVEIMTKFAQVTQDNFAEFLDYLLENTKQGKYFKAYYDALDSPNEVEKSIMQSRFISSVFSSSMIWMYVRTVSKQKLLIKQLAT